MVRPLYFLLLVIVCASCSVSRKSALTRYGTVELTSDYELFRAILEESHPGLYWYTPKDSMDFYFDKGRRMLRDSMNESEFRNVLSYVISKINCGHTTIRPSRAYARAAQNSSRMFPLGIKVWGDTAVVTSNLNRRDSQITRGSVLTAIDNVPIRLIVDSLFQHLSTDGYSITHKYQTLSNRGVFGGMYASIFGARPSYAVKFIDTLGRAKTATVSLFRMARDTTRGRAARQQPRPSRRETKQRLLRSNRWLHYDTASATAIMDLNTFSRGFRLRGFLYSSFRELRKNRTKDLIIDLRGNGGGSVTNSNLLIRFLSDKPYKVADSLYAITRRSKYGQYQSSRFANWLFLTFMTRKDKQKRYHFSYYEKHYFKPKKKNHFDGNVYLLTGGNTFSAASLVAQTLREQQNVTVVGEETGGGAYGNNAWLIPDVTLPATRVRFRLPLFRLVIDKDYPKTGRGVLPEIESLPTIEAIRKNEDFKMERILQMIRDKGKQASVGMN